MGLRSIARGNCRLSLALLGCALSSCSGTITTPEPDPIGERDGSGRGGSGVSNATENGQGGAADDARRSPSLGAPDPAAVSDGGLAVSAGGGSSGGTSTPMAEKVFCDAVSKVFIPSCGGGSCHNRPDVAFGDFAVGTAEAESFVNVQSVKNSVCGLLIDPVNPEDSLILRKVIGGFPAVCGGAMPVTGELTDEQLECVASWVQKFKGSE